MDGTRLRLVTIVERKPTTSIDLLLLSAGCMLPLAMEMESVEIETHHHAKIRPKMAKLSINTSFSDCEKATSSKHVPPIDTLSIPSLENSIATSSSSSAALDEPRVPRVNSAKATKSQAKTTDKPSHDEGCMTDRVVRFFCPFEEPCFSHDFQRKHEQASGGIGLSACYEGGVHSSAEDCSGAAWLQPVQLCIPDQWDGSPDRKSPSTRKKNIRNRCSTLQASKRRSDHIKSLRTQWHNPDSAIPLRSTRSETAKDAVPTQVTHSVSPALSAYYDSDPETPPEIPRYKKKHFDTDPKSTPEIPRYKRNRPTALNLNIGDDHDDESNDPPHSNFPAAPRHSSHKSKSFFDSPRSVVETPNLHNDDEVKAFIKVSCPFLH